MKVGLPEHKHAAGQFFIEKYYFTLTKKSRVLSNQDVILDIITGLMLALERTLRLKVSLRTRIFVLFIGQN